MKSTLRALSLLLLSLCSIAAAAATVVECEDAAGERTFLSVCPPGSTAVQSKEYQTEIPGAIPSAAELDVLIYLAPDCPACDAFMRFFNRYGITPTRKDITDNRELQLELMKIAGALKVPTVIIGETILSNYKEKELIDLIEGMGYSLIEIANP